MNELDIESLLEKNPQVDRKIIEETVKANADNQNPRHDRQGPLSPYAGRRLILDHKAKWGEVVEPQHRSHYGNR